MPAHESTIGDERNRAVRLAGFISLAAGLGLGYFLILRPLQEAKAGVPELSWGGGYGFTSPMLLLVGALLILFPGIFQLLASPKIIKPNGNLTGLGVVIAAGILLPIFALCLWINGYVEHQFQLLGYVEGHLGAGGQ